MARFKPFIGYRIMTHTPATGRFNYLRASVEPSLYRNGKVLTRRDRDGSDDEWIGVDLEETPMPVHDARQLEAARHPTLARNGFCMTHSPLARPDVDFLDHDEVVRRYYPQCADIVREASGASFAAAFDHNVRSAGGKSSRSRIRGGQQVQGPAHVVHGDYTLTSAPQRLRDLTRPAGENDTLSTVLASGATLLDGDEVDCVLASGRFAIINVWRNVRPEPVATHPLALCDAASVNPDDLVVFEIHYADRIGENYFARHAATHRWAFYSSLTRDEVLILKQWDSQGTLAASSGRHGDGDATSTFSFHSAFEDPSTADDAPDRWSIEVRCVALWS